MHRSKAKNELFDQLHKEVLTARKIIGDKIGFREQPALEDTSEIYFVESAAMLKYLVSTNDPFLSARNNFSIFIGVYFY